MPSSTVIIPEVSLPNEAPTTQPTHVCNHLPINPPTSSTTQNTSHTNEPNVSLPEQTIALDHPVLHGPSSTSHQPTHSMVT